jgi:hypothetical protein
MPVVSGTKLACPFDFAMPARPLVACAAAAAACCVLAYLGSVQREIAAGRGRGASELFQYPGKGGELYGFERDEAAVGLEERRSAMDSLQRALGNSAHLLTAKEAADEQLRWLRPFYARKMQEAQRVWGQGSVSSAVDLEGRSVDYTAVNVDKQSEWGKAAMGSRLVPLDAQVVPPSQAREKKDAEDVRRSVSGHRRAISPLSALGREGSHLGLRQAPYAVRLRRDAAGTQQLAEIYGVRITDKDAHKFFGKDYETKYKPPSPKELHDYIQYLADHQPPKPVNATEDADADAGGEEEEEEEEDEEKCEEGDVECESSKGWPEKPKFGKKFKTHAATQWCKWPGGEEEVPCQIGANGAYYDEPFSAGVWARHTPNRETMVNNGVWRFPGTKPPQVRILRVRLSTPASLQSALKQ